MRRRTNLPDAAARLLQSQAGVISTAQLLASGLSRRVVDRFTAGWEQVTQGVHLAGPPRWESAVWAGLLHGGAQATAGGMAACFLERALRDPPSTILVWAPNARRQLVVGDWTVEFRRGVVDAYRSPRRTRIHEGLLDAARTSNERDTIATIASAFSRQVADPGRLLEALELRQRQPHRATIEALCTPVPGLAWPGRWLPRLSCGLAV